MLVLVIEPTSPRTGLWLACKLIYCFIYYYLLASLEQNADLRGRLFG